MKKIIKKWLREVLEEKIDKEIVEGKINYVIVQKLVDEAFLSRNKDLDEKKKKIEESRRILNYRINEINNLCDIKSKIEINDKVKELKEERLKAERESLAENLDKDIKVQGIISQIEVLQWCIKN